LQITQRVHEGCFYSNNPNSPDCQAEQNINDPAVYQNLRQANSFFNKVQAQQDRASRSWSDC
jgi:hypothetical protein